MSRAAEEALCSFVPPFMQFLREGLAELKMSPARFQLMQALHYDGATSMVALAKRLCVTKRNITTLVTGMEKDGLAMRAAHPSDQRAKLVTLSDKGHQTYRKAEAIQRGHLRDLLSAIDAQEQQEMAQALRRLITAMEKRGPSDARAM